MCFRKPRVLCCMNGKYYNPHSRGPEKVPMVLGKPRMSRARRCSSSSDKTAAGHLLRLGFQAAYETLG